MYTENWPLMIFLAVENWRGGRETDSAFSRGSLTLPTDWRLTECQVSGEESTAAAAASVGGRPARARCSNQRTGNSYLEGSKDKVKKLNGTGPTNMVHWKSFITQPVIRQNHL